MDVCELRQVLCPGIDASVPEFQTRLQTPNRMCYKADAIRTGDTDLATIPKILHEHINSAFPVNVCLIAIVLPDGFAQVTPRGSTMVFDDEHLALWERSKGTTTANLKDGTKVTIFFRKPQLRESGVLPKGGIARFYGVATLHKSGAIYEEIWKRVIQPEKDRDPEKKGFGVLINVERAEDLDGAPLNLNTSTESL